MHNLPLIEEYYKKFITNLYSWIPEDVYSIDLELLHRYDLLHFHPNAGRKDPALTRHFHVIESPNKMTLVNDEFVVWIIPDKVDNTSLTYTLIALNRGEQEPQLEAAFIASGVYNSSKLVLSVLEKFLIEIQETTRIISKFNETA